MKKNSKLILSLSSLTIFLITLILVTVKTPSIDNWISQNIKFLWGPFNGFFIFLGNYSRDIMILLALIFAGFLYLRKRKKESVTLILGLSIGYILEEIIKILIQRTRPAMQLVTETDYSFPSGHSIFSIILFSLIIYFYKDEIKNKTLKILFIIANILVIILIGFSRIYLNVHWFTDVVGGYAIGFFVANLLLFILKESDAKNNHREHRKNNYFGQKI